MERSPRLKVLLDTHIWLWSLLEPDRLSRRVRKVLESPSTDIWVSPISTWEILQLAERGRLALKPNPTEWLTKALLQASFEVALLTHEVALATADVTLPHRDPADRFLAATARTYDLTLVTADQHLVNGTGYTVLANR